MTSAANSSEQQLAADLPRAGDHVVRCGQTGIVRDVRQQYPGSWTVAIEVQGQLKFYRWTSEWQLVSEKRRGS